MGSLILKRCDVCRQLVLSEADLLIWNLGLFALVDDTWRRLNLQIQAFLAFCLPVWWRSKAIGWLCSAEVCMNQTRGVGTGCADSGPWLYNRTDRHRTLLIYLSSSSAAAAVHYALRRLFWDAPPALVRWSDRFLDEALTDSIALIPSISCNWKPHSNCIPQSLRLRLQNRNPLSLKGSLF